jgi:hypothetical protein
MEGEIDVCVYIYIYIHTQTHIIHRHAYMSHTCLCKSVSIYMHTYTHIRIHTRTWRMAILFLHIFVLHAGTSFGFSSEGGADEPDASASCQTRRETSIKLVRGRRRVV